MIVADARTQQVPAGEPAGTMAGGGFLPPIPRAPAIHTVPQTKPPITKTPIKETVPGLKTTPETGLDYEGKPYLVESTVPIRTAGKNLASQTQIGVKKGLTKVGGGFSRIFGGLGRGLGGLLGGIAGGGGRFLTKVGIGGAESLARIGTQLSTGSIIKGPPIKFWLILLGAFLLVGTLTAFAPAPAPSQPSPIVYTPGAASGLISCPLNGTVVITNGSKDAGGHCSPSYEIAYGVCTKPASTGYTGRDTAIDVTSSDRLVYLPRVQGTDKVKWVVDETGNVPITEGEGGGISVAARTTVSSKTYRIRFVHIESTTLKIGDIADASALVGQYYLNNPYGAHVHITLQEDGVFKPADLYFNLCK